MQLSTLRYKHNKKKERRTQERRLTGRAPVSKAVSGRPLGAAGLFYRLRAIVLRAPHSRLRVP